MKSKILTSIILFTSLSMLAADEETAKENYLFKIYQKYHSQPTPEETWEKALSQRKSQEYTITKGDTLWDVSKTLFADGFFWSKVWSLNPYITNPHQISVGQVIHFYQGAGLEAPGLNVNQSSQTPVLTAQTSMVNTQWWKSENLAPIPIDLSDVTIPPPSKMYPNVLEVFPSSLPSWYFQTDAEVDKMPIEILPADIRPITNILNLPFFISEYPQDVKGVIYEIEKNAKTASERDYLFIDPDEDLKMGETYTVIQAIGKIRDPEAIEDFPKSYEVQGELKIVGKVEGYYKALVTVALFPIQVGAQIVPGESPKMNLTEPGTMAPLQGMIIGGENDTTRSLFGPQSIVYINRGSNDGVKLNHRAPVMAVHRMRHSDSTIFSNTWKLGEVKIIKVEKNYSTAVVMDATDGIVPGDIVGELRPSDITENFKNLNSSTSFGDDEESVASQLGKPLKRKNEEELNKELDEDEELGSGSEDELESESVDKKVEDTQSETQPEDSLEDEFSDKNNSSADSEDKPEEKSEDNLEDDDF